MPQSLQFAARAPPDVVRPHNGDESIGGRVRVCQRVTDPDNDVGKAGQVDGALGNFDRQILQERQCAGALFERRCSIARRNRFRAGAIRGGGHIWHRPFQFGGGTQNLSSSLTNVEPVKFTVPGC